MAIDQTKQSFYGEVDKFRYRTNWGCLSWILLVIALVVLVAWWIWKKL